MSQRAKLMAAAGMASGYALFWLASRPSLLVAGIVALFILAAAIYVASRPAPDLGRAAMRDTAGGRQAGATGGKPPVAMRDQPKQKPLLFQ